MVLIRFSSLNRCICEEIRKTKPLWQIINVFTSQNWNCDWLSAKQLSIVFHAWLVAFSWTYHFMIKFKRNNTKVRNSRVKVTKYKFHLGIKGCGKLFSPLVHFIGQLISVVTSVPTMRVKKNWQTRSVYLRACGPTRVWSIFFPEEKVGMQVTSHRLVAD